MKLRTTIRFIAGVAVVLYVWGCMSAVHAQTPWWPLWGLSAGVLLILITAALYRRRSAC